MTIWRSLRSLADLNSGGSGTLVEHLGIEFSEIGADFVRATMPVDHRTRQPYGLLHGGASVALAETVASTGATMCVDAAEYLCVGQEINANHVRSARSGRVTATARPVHLGGRTHVWTIDIVNDDGKLVCTSRLTVAIVRRGTLGG
ncbi:MAG TPA: hotdog fold thioesterase [Steroidobacteraceae bacterium]